MRTLSQKYAKDVFEKVKAAREKFPASEDAQKYRSMTETLPVLILQSGLAQALTFLQSRGEKAQQQLLTDLSRVVTDQPREEFVNQCLGAELDEYAYLTRKSLVALSWFKRFSASVLGDQDAEDNSEEAL